MKKIYSFLLLGLLLSIGNVWAETIDDVLNQTFTGVTGSSYTNFSNKTGTSGAVYAGQCAGGNSSIQLRSNNNNSGVITTTSGGKAKKVTVVWQASTSNGRTLNVYGKNTAYSAATDLYGDDAGTLLGTIVKGTSTELTISGDYTFIGFRSASSAMYLTSVTITWDDGAAATACAKPSITGSDNFYESTEVTITCGTEGASIYYTLDGSTPTSASTAYSAPFEITATTTVKAIAQKDGLNDSEVASATFTKATILTVAQAIAALDEASPINDQYVHGIISQIDTYGSNAITYWISDDGTTTNQLEVYKGKGLNGANFSAITDLQVGDIVTIHGNLKIYNVTKEFDSFSSLVSFERPVVTTPSIDLSSTSIEAPAAGIEDGEITVTYNNITTVVAELVFCNAQGIAVQDEYDWVLAGLNEGNNIVYTIAANTGAARTAYMKVSALTDNSDIIYSDLITISQAEYVAPGHGDTAEDPFTVTEVLSGAATGNDVYVEGYIVGFVTGTASFTPEISSGNNSNWAFAASADETDFANVIPVQITSANQAQYGLGKHPYLVGAKMIVKGDIMTYFSKSGVKNTDEFTLVSATLTLGTNGYSTFAADFNFTVSGAQAYKAKYQNGAIVLTEVNTVAAGEGIILKGTEGATVSIVPAEVADDFTDNELVGVLEPVYAEGSYYVLATLDNDGITKFHPCPGVEIPANKAFIIIDDVNNAPVRIVFAENGATNIEQLDGSEKAVKFFENGNLFFLRNGVVYDATGRVVR